MGSNQVVLLYVSIYHTCISQWMAKMCRRSRAQTALLRAKAQFPAGFEGHLKRSPCGLYLQMLWQTCGPARQCPTVLTCTLCLPWTAARWFLYAYCWWLSALLIQFLPNFVSPVTSTAETNNILVFADKTANKNCPIVGDQQALDPPHAVNCKGTSAAHAVPQTVTWPTVKADTRRLLLIPVSSATRSAMGCYRSAVKFTVDPQ